MAPFRIPFTSKKTPASRDPISNNENVDPNSPYGRDKPSLALGMKEKKDEPNEFKLSCELPPLSVTHMVRRLIFSTAVTDNGEYMPVSVLRDHAVPNLTVT